MENPCSVVANWGYNKINNHLDSYGHSIESCDSGGMFFTFMNFNVILDTFVQGVHKYYKPGAQQKEPISELYCLNLVGV